VHNALPFSEKSTAVEGTIATRLIGDLRGRIGGGWQWADITNTANQFHSDGYTARASFEHPRVQVNATINDTVSNSLPIYNQIVGNLGIGGVVIVPPAVIPSDFRAMSFTLHAYPLKKLELSALWTRSRQHIDGYLSNDFQMTNVYVTYHFRRIQIEAGFIRTNQIFAAYPFALRQRFYIRFLRSVKFI
jgi:hypothetical protein